MPSIAENFSTKRQRYVIHAIALGPLKWKKVDISKYIKDQYDALSTHDLTSNQAAQLISHLKALADGRARDIDGSTTAAERMTKWNAFFATPNALRTGLPRSADAPDPRKLRHVLGMLWEVSRRASFPEPYAQTIIFRACQKYKIDNAEDCDKLFTALKTRSRKQRCPR